MDLRQRSSPESAQAPAHTQFGSLGAKQRIKSLRDMVVESIFKAANVGSLVGSLERLAALKIDVSPLINQRFR
jgi:hypothetical protein